MYCNNNNPINYKDINGYFPTELFNWITDIGEDMTLIMEYFIGIIMRLSNMLVFVMNMIHYRQRYYLIFQISEYISLLKYMVNIIGLSYGKDSMENC